MTNKTTTTNSTAAKPVSAAPVIQKKAISPASPNKPLVSKTSTVGKATVTTKTSVPAKITPVKKPVVKAVKPLKSTDKSKADKHKTDKAKSDKPKLEKVKMERDSFTMPKEEYAQLAVLKARMSSLGKPVKKSELLRAGIKLLTGLSDPNLQTLMASVPVIKTGRPKKK